MGQEVGVRSLQVRSPSCDLEPLKGTLEGPEAENNPSPYMHEEWILTGLLSEEFAKILGPLRARRDLYIGLYGYGELPNPFSTLEPTRKPHPFPKSPRPDRTRLGVEF